ncbi:U3 small nucleolar RNA-associated protein 10, partial [Bienertia sinuspersici]
ANQQFFPIAYAVVSEESTDNWHYFFRSLRLTLQEAGRDDWTFISDKMRGVEGSLANNFPKASRRICCRHLGNLLDHILKPIFSKQLMLTMNRSSTKQCKRRKN